LLCRKDYLQSEQPRESILPKAMNPHMEPKGTAECSTALVGGVLPEVTKKQISSQGGMHRTVNVLRLEDIGGGRPSSREANVR
jgi:hypothetical protein